MILPALALGVLAVILAWPAPVALARASWPRRAPATALLLWQAIALAGGLSMIGALVCAGLDPYGNELVAAAQALVNGLLNHPRSIPIGAVMLPIPPPATSILALALAALLSVYLFVHLVITVTRVERGRRRHRAVLELLSSPSPDYRDLLLLDDDGTVAYCLPVGFRTLTVVSRGLVARLDGGALAAVIAHERAHVEQRHDVVLVAFRAWRAALPFLPTARLASEQVALLVELLADDRALRFASRAQLAEAIAGVAAVRGAHPGDAAGDSLHVGAGEVASDAAPDAAQAGPAGPAGIRVQRLIAPPAPLPAAGVWGARLLAVALVAAPTLYLLTPSPA